MDYRDRLYSRYASEHTAHLYGERSRASAERQFPVWRAYFGEWLPKKKDAAVLDIGCGEGSFVLWLQSQGLRSARGVDISAEQIAAGEAMGVKNLVREDITAYLPKHEGQFDCIFARDIFEHFRKDEILDVLDLLARALKPDGSIIIQTVNAENLLWGRLRHGDFTHENALTSSSAHQVLSVTGFHEIDVRPQRPVAHGIVSGLRALLWRVIELKLRCYLLIETGSSQGIFTQNLLIHARKKS